MITRIFSKLGDLIPLPLLIHAVLVAFLTVVFTLIFLNFRLAETNNKLDAIGIQVSGLRAANEKLVEIMLYASSPSATPTPTETPKLRTKVATQSGIVK
jgi:hypothetical protein